MSKVRIGGSSSTLPSREAAHTKGGYLEGTISLPPFHGILRLELQTWPAADVDPEVAEIHPILLHVVRIGKVI